VAETHSSAAIAFPSVGHGKLVACLLASIVAHSAFVYFSPVWFPRPESTTSGAVAIEVWSEPVPVPQEVSSPVPVPVQAAAEVPRAVAAPVRAPRPPPTEAEVSKVVQHKGLLRAFASLGAVATGSMAGGSAVGPPSQGASAAGMGPAELPSGSGTLAFDRGGSGTSGPATLGAIGVRHGSGQGAGTGGTGELVGAGLVGTEGGSVSSSSVSEADVSAFVRARTGGIKACYESQLRREPALQGRIRVRFKILEDGSVSQLATVESTLASSEVEACVFRVIRGWRTPFRPTEAAEVEYPFVFSLR